MKFLIISMILCANTFVNAQTEPVRIVASEPSIIVIYFDFNSSEISSSELSKLTILKDDEYEIIAIEAHTDSTGSMTYNNSLASKRLESVLAQINFNKSETKVIGEKQANSASNYIAAEFRKVEISYMEPEPLAPTMATTVSKTAEAETSLNDVDDFISSDESTLSIDLSIHFQPGTAVPLDESRPELKRLLDFLLENTAIDAFLHGHVCCAPDIGISEKRASYVYNFLIKNGVDQDRLRKKGHGNTRPKVSPEITEEDRIANRRVTVVFTKH